MACIGVVMIPGAPQLTAKDIRYRINNSQAKCIIADNSAAEKTDEVHLAACLSHVVTLSSRGKVYIGLYCLSCCLHCLPFPPFCFRPSSLPYIRFLACILGNRTPVDGRPETSTTTRSYRDPETAVIHFWLPGGVRR